MLTVEDFNMPDKHPYGMLANDYEINHVNQSESLLTALLAYAIEKGDIQSPMPTKYEHDTLQRLGYLQGNAIRGYWLSQKSLKKLHPYFGKEK